MREIVYKGRDNTNDFILKADGVAVDLTGVTKMDLVFPDVPEPVRSDLTPGVFDWSPGGGKLNISLGHLGFLTSGRFYTARLNVYDADHPSGIYWGDIRFIVKG
jgi:hypothetical protein